MKTRHRTETEDRAIPYKDWLRTWDNNGFFMDLDMIKFRKVNGVVSPVVITELTRYDSEGIPGIKYLEAIEKRFLFEDMQGIILKRMSTLLNIPAYIVLFPKDTKWFYVYSMQKNEWRLFTPQKWINYLGNL